MPAPLELGGEGRHRLEPFGRRTGAPAHDCRDAGVLRVHVHDVGCLAGGAIEHDEREQTADAEDVAARVGRAPRRLGGGEGSVAEEVLGVAVERLRD